MQIQKDILSRISTLKTLPTLPHILVKLIGACNSEDADLSKISGLVEKDPSLSGKILRLVNSAHYGLPKRIESVHHCVSYLGTSTIKNIAIGASISQAFQPWDGSNLLNLKVFWWHSLKCAVLARLMARKTGYKSPDEAFLSGLLHDIGRLVLWVNYPKAYTELLKKYSGRPDLLLAGEIRQGLTHCEVGAWLLHRWGLPSLMVDAVLYHHESREKIKTAFPLVRLVYAANVLSERPLQKGEQPDNIAELLCGLGPDDVRTLLSRADEEVFEVARLLEIQISEPADTQGAVSENDRKAQEGLVAEVRDISLLLGTLQDLMGASDEASILRVIHQGIHILFDIREIFFFEYDREKDCLRGKPVSENDKSAVIDNLVIPMQTAESVPVACLAQGKMLELFIDAGVSDPVIVDARMIRFMGTEGMFCLPMLAHGEYVGVIVLGLDHSELSHLSGQSNLLSLFCRQAALALHADKMRRAAVTTIQSERARASTGIARKIFHEVNNPLGIIKNYLNILGLKLAKQNVAQEEIAIVSREIDRIAHILRSLRSFSEPEARSKAPVDVNKVLTDLVKITRESLKRHSGIEVHLDLSPSLPMIISEEDSLKQIFINLVKNAAEAMTEGGNLYIGTRHISGRLEGVEITGKGEEEEEGYVEITIKDDGPGIPEEIRTRLFDPFVTSKGDGHSGLGLSIVHNLVKSLDGTITCDSDSQKGTCFKIGLPVSPKKNERNC